MTTLAELVAQPFNVGGPEIVATGRVAASIHVDRARHDQEADLFKRAWSAWCGKRSLTWLYASDDMLPHVPEQESVGL